MIEVAALIIAVLTLILGDGLLLRIRRARTQRRVAQSSAPPIQSGTPAAQGSSRKGGPAPDTYGGDRMGKGSITQESLAQTGFSDTVEEIKQEREIAAELGKIGFDETLQAIAKAKTAK